MSMNYGQFPDIFSLDLSLSVKYMWYVNPLQKFFSSTFCIMPDCHKNCDSTKPMVKLILSVACKKDCIQSGCARK